MVRGVPEGGRIVALEHTHGAGVGFEHFSDADINLANLYAERYAPTFRGICVATPGGRLLFYEAGTLTPPAPLSVQRQWEDFVGSVGTR